MLKELPGNVYSSEFLECILDLFWENTQKRIILTQFAPYIAFVSAAITYMVYHLKDRKIEGDITDGSQVLILIHGFAVLVLLINQLRLEVL